MSLIVGPYYRGNPKQKPKQWGSISHVNSNLSGVSTSTKLPKPIGFWPMWDSCGSTASDVISNKNGTIYGPSWDRGQLEFSSVDEDYLSLHDHASFFDGYSTGTIVISFTATDLNTINTLFCIANTAAVNEYLVFYVGASTSYYDNESINVAYKNGAVSEMNAFIREGSSAYLNNKKHTAAFVVDGIDNTFYIDGIKKTTWFLIGTKTKKNFTNFSTSANSMLVGERLLNAHGTVYDGTHLDGAIDYVKIFDVPLTADQVAEEYYNPYALIQPPTFRTYFIPDAGLSCPIITSPTNASSGVTQPITFSWTAVTGATNYQLQIAESEAGLDSSPPVDEVITSPSTTKEISGLDPSTTHYARVRAQTS